MFETRIPIRYFDTDALGHVNYAAYLTYIEELLLRWIVPVLGEDAVVVHAEVDFVSELRYGDGEVVGKATLSSLGTSSIKAAVVLERVDGIVVFRGELVLVAFDARQRRSRPLTESEKSQIRSQS